MDDDFSAALAGVVSWLRGAVPTWVKVESDPLRSPVILISPTGSYAIDIEVFAARGDEQALRDAAVWLLSEVQDLVMEESTEMWPPSRSQTRELPHPEVEILSNRSLRAGYADSQSWVLAMNPAGSD
jgi:hypothetical protein